MSLLGHPPLQVCKINTDGVVDVRDETSTLGMVVRDIHGFVLLSAVTKVSYFASLLDDDEVQTILFEFRLCIDYNFHSIIFENGFSLAIS